MTPAHNHNKHDAHDHNADPKKPLRPCAIASKKPVSLNKRIRPYDSRP